MKGMHVFACLSECVCVCVCVRARVCVCVCAYVSYVHVCVYVRVYFNEIHTLPHTKNGYINIC